jgi:hypothetical protein
VTITDVRLSAVSRSLVLTIGVGRGDADGDFLPRANVMFAVKTRFKQMTAARRRVMRFFMFGGLRLWRFKATDLARASSKCRTPPDKQRVVASIIRPEDLDQDLEKLTGFPEKQDQQNRVNPSRFLWYFLGCSRRCIRFAISVRRKKQIATFTESFQARND